MVGITIRNYRCFADDAPLQVEWRPGFLAFVGPNNSGKSTALKWIYEFRALVGLLASDASVASCANGGAVALSVPDIEDHLELFHSANSRSLSIQFDLPVSAEAEVSRVVFLVDRANPVQATPEVYCGPNHIRVAAASQESTGWVFRAPPHTALRPDCRAIVEFGRSVANALYVGPFRTAVAQGSGKYFDLEIGASFIQRWDNLKTGGNRQFNAVAQRVTEDIARIFGYQQIELNAAAGQREVQVIADGNPYRLRELGTGLTQFLVVLGNVAYRKPSYLVIDEPELNLHPSLQINFLTTLASYSTGGVAFATHSIGLARATAERILACRREGERSVVRPFEELANLTEFAGEMSFSAFNELGCSTILLVEGVTDVKTVQQLLRLYHADHKVVLLPLGGAQMIRPGRQLELAELKRLTRDVAVLIDSERAAAGASLAPERAVFIRDCEDLGFRVHVTGHRSIENYFTQRAVERAKGASVTALGPHEALSAHRNGWPKADNWRIAREMAADELNVMDIGPFLASFA